MKKNNRIMISKTSVVGLVLLGMLILSACQAEPQVSSQANSQADENVSMAPTQVIEASPTSNTSMAEGGSGNETAGTVEVDLVDNRFEPSELTIKAGTTVTFRNVGSRTHTVTADDGLFDSGTLKSGDTFTFTFTEAGKYAFYCKPHGGPEGVGMSGVIIVNTGN